MVLDGFLLEDLKARKQQSIVVFSKKDCPPCEAAKPAIVASAQLAADAGSKITFAAIDCTFSSELCKAEGVLKMPTIKFLDGGTFADRKWPHSADWLLGYVDAVKSKEASIEITDDKDELDAAKQV